MKKLFGLILICITWCNIGLALTQEEAISKYFKNEKLDIIEGIWLNESNGGIYAVHTSGTNNFVIRIINHRYFPSGEITGVLSKGSNTVYYGKALHWRGIEGDIKFNWCKGAVWKIIDKRTYQTSCKTVSSKFTKLWPSNSTINENISKSPDDDKIIPASSGSGFFVSKKGHMITNYHVIEGCNAVKAFFKGEAIDAKILSVDKINDLAIIKAELKPSKIYPVSKEDVTLLEDIIIAGYPLGKKVSQAIKTSKGSVTALAGYGDNFSEFQTDAALNQGNSGGPIINKKGNIVGVAVANYGKEEGVESFNFGIKASTLNTFANANGLMFLPPNNRELSNQDLGQLITEATIYLECHMTVAKIKRMIAKQENRKAFFSEYK